MPKPSILLPLGETLDLQEAADFLRLGYEAMKQLVTDGAVPALVLNRKHTVILRDELVSYVRVEGRRQAEERRRKNCPTKVRLEPKLRGGARTRAILEKFEAANRVNVQGSFQSAVDRLVCLNEVIATIAVSRANFYRMMRVGRFPRPLKIGARNCWLESDVIAFIDECTKRRQSSESPGRAI
ncbi:helix-turn-helix transcriptional regulator [Dyella kyungheensis]|uniref:helix-turn-helix transcriptional regulator n=1 Tax=Dyella kyungheensis TaxID=1242174 RepID=UPI003CEC1EA1